MTGEERSRLGGAHEGRSDVAVNKRVIRHGSSHEVPSVKSETDHAVRAGTPRVGWSYLVPVHHRICKCFSSWSNERFYNSCSAHII